MFSFFPRAFAACALAAALAACATASAPAGADVYAGFTLLDPATERRIDNAYIVVAAGRIVDAGAGLGPAVAPDRRHDMSGAFALPGLIDTHAHVTLGRLAVTRTNGAPAIAATSEDDITAHNARMLVAFGVTTIRNPGGATEANAAYAEGVRSGALLGPEARAAGEILDRMPFQGLTAVVTDAASIEAAVAAQAAAGMNYIKLYHLLDEAQFTAGVEAAHRHGLEAITHTGGITWDRAAELGVDAIVHAMPISADALPLTARDDYRDATETGAHAFYEWWERADLDSPEMQRLIAALVEHDVTVDLTLVVFQKTFWGDDPTVRDTGAAYTHPLMRQNWQTFRFDIGWREEHYRRARAVWPKIMRFARMLHEAGVKLTIGTDQANPFVAPGFDTIAEMRLHQEAGIPPWAVLRMATSQAAETLHMEDRIGRIARGMEADIVFLDADPTRDVANAATTRAILINGELHDAAALRAVD
ncbi:MAG TPA: amidohydrolase family protein [Vitreimonas sp.]|uniref:amidohydrolase family protein n=1 Tax=Vitreimonas sp. TaxID=3069702 RepID=UPI002D710CD5|nr:amidohydrolase family protein [Vitreimonas sp.]HYD88444.1 amidohydrolase family protein [Vitreimonas sp.]